MKQWRAYCEKFLNLTPREQYIIATAGFVVVIMVLNHFFLDSNLKNITQYKTQVSSLKSGNKTALNTINLYNESLAIDPNIDVQNKIAQQKEKLAAIDESLLALTTDLINPVQMRFALLELLKLQKGVSLVSFEVSPAQPMMMVNTSSDAKNQQNNSTDESTSETVKVNVEHTEVGLYKHAITIKLKGQYFQLKNYLASLEDMSYTFFWQEFDYQLKEYPVSELQVTLYSISTKREFIGV